KPVVFCAFLWFSLLPASHHQRAAEREFELRFRGDIQFFAFGQDLNCGCASAANTGTNCGAFASSGNGSNGRANTGTDACAFGGFLSAAFPDFVVFGSCYRIGNRSEERRVGKECRPW